MLLDFNSTIYGVAEILSAFEFWYRAGFWAGLNGFWVSFVTQPWQPCSPLLITVQATPLAGLCWAEVHQFTPLQFSLQQFCLTSSLVQTELKREGDNKQN